MATTRTQSAIQADLAAAQRGTGGCSYYHDNMSTLTTSNYNRLHGDITNTMLPNKVNKYTEIHTNGVGHYNDIKTYIAENLS